MLVLYSQLKKYLPDLKASPKEIADVYTLTGFMLDKFHEVEYQKKPDYLLDLEVRQNRADAFGVEGLARELSAYYNIPLSIPNYSQVKSGSEKLDIEVKAKKAVKRLMAIRIDNVKLEESPRWLKDYLAFYGINSINNLVDLTNYVMLETGHPSHAFDADKIKSKKLVWEIHPGYKKMTTLDGSEIDLVDEALVVSDGEKPLALAGIVGGKDAEIDENSKNIIVEMAVYDGALIRRNARQMRVLTEASSRLEKFLDPETIPSAFNMLIRLIIENCHGDIVSSLYDNYLQPTKKVEIHVDLDKVQQIAGITISHEESIHYLKRLGFSIKLPLASSNESKIIVLRPQNRLDIEIEEDVFEEIIRLKGFDKIPSNKLTLEVVKDITPNHIKFIDKVAELLSTIGLDEVRSWVLVDEKQNEKCSFDELEAIKVTNSINEEVPFLRQTITVSLLGQLENCLKNNINPTWLFEIGRVFGRKKNEYLEHDSLGIIINGRNINLLKSKVETLIRSLGTDTIEYSESKIIPASAHPLSCWDIVVSEKRVGIIYLVNSNEFPESVVAEINLNELGNLVNPNNATKEITQKLVQLDVNIELDNLDDINSRVLYLIKSYKEDIWSWEIIDRFAEKDKIKYTLRVSYVNLDDTKAKKLHAKIFKV